MFFVFSSAEQGTGGNRSLPISGKIWWLLLDS